MFYVVLVIQRNPFQKKMTDEIESESLKKYPPLPGARQMELRKLNVNMYVIYRGHVVITRNCIVAAN